MRAEEEGEGEGDGEGTAAVGMKAATAEGGRRGYNGEIGEERGEMEMGERV